MSRCYNCGAELTTGDADGFCSSCRYNYPPKQKPVLTGWICPRCGVVHSPFVTECNCPVPVKIWTGTKTNPNEFEEAKQ